MSTILGPLSAVPGCGFHTNWNRVASGLGPGNIVKQGPMMLHCTLHNTLTTSCNMEGYERICEEYPQLPKNLKDEQKKGIDSICSGRHTLVVLPTGYGKSLVYIVSALLQRKIALIITPLKALMMNQVRTLTRKGISALGLSSRQEMTPEDKRRK